MPLPLLLLGGAALVGSVFGAAAKSVNHDYEVELNSINEEIEELVEEVQREYEDTERRTQEALAQWTETRQQVANDSFRRFAAALERLKHVELEGSVSPVALKEAATETAIAYKLNARTSLSGKSQSQVEKAGAITGAIATVAFGAIGGGIFVVGQMFKGVKLQGAIDDAKEELARVKVKAEEVRKAARQLQLVQRRARELREVTVTLDRLFLMAIGRLDLVVREAGADFRRYSPEQRQVVKLAFHLGDAMAQLLNVPLLNADHKLTTRSKEVLQNARAVVKAEAM